MKKLIFLAGFFSFLTFATGCASSKIPASDIPDDSKKTAEQILSELSVEEKVGQLFLIEPDQFDPKFGNVKNYKYWKSVPSAHKNAFERYQVGGFILFGGNIKSKAQLKKLNAQMTELCKIPPFIAVDEEGGRVTRLARTEALEIKNVGSMESIGATGDVENARKAGEYIGSYLSEYGFTWDFAPDTDVNTNPENRVIGDRAFSSDPELVSAMANAYLDGLHEHKVLGCVKHFPGHGDTKDDTHEKSVYVAKNWEELKKSELIPFVKTFKNTDSVMIAHVSLPNVTSDGLPASLSKELITGKLRGELGYEGVILTDSLGMNAIKKHYTPGEAAVMAFNAGNDIILMPAEFFKAYDGVLEAVRNGVISESRLDESVLRILKLKGF